MSAPSVSESPIAAVADSQPARGPVDQRRDDSSGSPLSGPKPPTAAGQTADADQIQADAAATALPAAILHRHALESVFAFLDLRELAVALRVARDWLGAVQSLRRLETNMDQPSVETLLAAARSTMGRHVSSLWSMHLDAATLSVLAERMPHLRDLHGVFQLPPPGESLILPANLHLLQICLAGRPDAAQLNAAVASIGRLSLLEELAIMMDALDPRVSFAPLAALPLLRRLNINLQCREKQPSDAQIDQLRALPHLREFEMRMSTPLLRRLLRQPHQLRWQQISLPDPLNDEAVALLPQLPSLTAIDGVATCGRFEWLRGLPNLATVHLSFFVLGGTQPEGHAESLVAGLRCCTNIQILMLDDCADLTTAHLAELLPRLPRLRELLLGHLGIDSLAFLAQLPMTSQLRRLEMNCCKRLVPFEVRHIMSLRALEQLTLTYSFTAPLFDEERAQLEPPSILLPLLAEFDYSPPEYSA